jgi:hypothetical protein
MADVSKELYEILYDGNSSFEKVSTAFTVMSVAQPVEEISPGFDINNAWELLIPDEFGGKVPDRLIVSSGKNTFGYVELYDGDYDFFEGLLEAYNKKNDLQGIDALDEFNELQDIGGVVISDCALPINTLNIMSESTPLVDLFDYFIENEIAFIMGKNNKVTHTITFADLDSIPIKMCLFALLLDLEVKMKELLEKQPNLDSYLIMLSPNSAEKINKFAKRKYSHCKEISAKQMLEFTNINEKHSMIRDHLAKSNKDMLKSMDPWIKKFQSLRNSIAPGDPLAYTINTPQDLNGIIYCALTLIKIVYEFITIETNASS